MKAEERPTLKEPLSRRMWKLQRENLFKKYGYRCCICRESFGASKLTVKHLSYPGPERSSELNGFRVFCFLCLA